MAKQVSISFDYTVTGSPASVELTVDEDYLFQANWTAGHQLHLDGNLDPDTTAPSDAAGVAPNEDDYMAYIDDF